MELVPHMAAVVIVDIEKYSKRTDSVQADLRQSLYETMHQAVSAAGLGWESAPREDRGDSIMLFFHSASPVHLLGALVREIDQALRHRNQRFADAYQMRLRMTVHHGPIAQDANGWVGSTINEAARLVDAGAVRDALTENPDASLALIIGDALHRSVVAGGGHASVLAEEYLAVRATAKSFDEPAWVRIPGVPPRPVPAVEPDALGSGRPDPTRPPEPAPLAPEPAAPSPHGHIGNVISGGTFTDSTIIGGNSYGADGQRRR